MRSSGASRAGPRSASCTAARRTRTGSTGWRPLSPTATTSSPLDQRGHGASDWSPAAAYATPDFAGDLLGVADALGWERMTLAGHSMGGHNAMAFAAWHPERLSALVIIDSRPSLPGTGSTGCTSRGHRGPRRHEALATALASFRLLPRETVAAPALLEHMAREGIVERDGRFMYRFDPQANGARRPTDNWPLLERIAAPTLIVRGEHSPILPPAMVEDMVRRIPDVRVVEIPRVYHHLVLDAPEAFTAVLEGFLAEVGKAAVARGEQPGSAGEKRSVPDPGLGRRDAPDDDGLGRRTAKRRGFGFGRGPGAQPEQVLDVGPPVEPLPLDALPVALRARRGSRRHRASRASRRAAAPPPPRQILLVAEHDHRRPSSYQVGARAALADPA